MFKLGVSTVDAALDWVWLVDFGQGNLTTAHIEAEVSVLSQWNTSSLFARGVVHQLQGEYKQALSLFEEAFVSATNFQEQYTFAAVAYFTELQAREILPDGCLVMVEGNRAESLWRQRFNQLKNHLESKQTDRTSSVLSSSCSLEGDFIDFIAVAIPTWRTILGRLGDSVQQEHYLREIHQKFTENLESYQNLDIFTIAKSLYSVLAELLALTGKVRQGWNILDKLVEAHKQHEKCLETAWYLLCQGDLLISIPSFGKPIVFGYHLSTIVEPWLEKPLDHSTLDCATAQQLYLEAQQYFIAAGASRGEGMATLRLAYLNGITQQWNLATYGYEKAQACFEAVGDRLNAMAAEMGKFWTYLHSQDLNEAILARASELASISRENGAIAQGVGWGLTFALAAQEALKQEKNAEVALNLARLAETILTVFTEDRHLLPWQLYQQILSKYNSIMQALYTDLAEIFVEQDDWSKAFNLAEMARVYSLRQALGAISQQHLTIIEIDKIPFYLPPDTLVITYLLTKKYLLAWAVNSEGLTKYYQLNELNGKPFSSQELLKATQDWLEQLSKREPVKIISRILEQSFLTYFSQEIARAQHIVVIPCATLSQFPFTTLLWRTKLLAKQKCLSYLSAASQLAYFNSLQSTTQKALFIAYPEVILQPKTNSSSLSSLPSPSILEGVAKIMADLYEVHPLVGTQVNQERVLSAIAHQPRIIHLFIQQATLSNLDLSQLELKADTVILTIADPKISQLTNNQLTGMAQSLIYTGAKAVLINHCPLGGLKDVAASILLLYLHLSLYAGHSLAESLWEAQQQLEIATVEEVLNFCHAVQSCIPWQRDSDRANRALITRYMGDILVLGEDYVRAAEAYEVARKIFYSIGYSEQAKAFEQKYQKVKNLAQTESNFHPEKLIFNCHTFWDIYKIVGDWQQSYY